MQHGSGLQTDLRYALCVTIWAFLIGRWLKLYFEVADRHGQGPHAHIHIAVILKGNTGLSIAIASQSTANWPFHI